VFLFLALCGLGSALGEINAAQNPYTTCPHVVVVGGGLAGLTTVLSVLDENLCATVTLVEQSKKIGGNSAKASSGINGAGTPEQVSRLSHA
jgi:succinate dehydrogenase/fumarate reductase flavoprotein subunit